VAEGIAQAASAVRFAIEVSREDLHEVDNDSTRERRQRESNRVQEPMQSQALTGGPTIGLK
jgi:hypothetical protein